MSHHMKTLKKVLKSSVYQNMGLMHAFIIKFTKINVLNF